jgi:membrane-associated phospholipid phosphatase
MIVLGLQYVYPKPELHLLLNSYHTSLQDTFFKYYSMLAEWPLYILALLPILWKKIQMTIFFALCELSGGAVLQILKHLISTDRPVSVFEHYPNLMLPLVDGVSMHHSNSFPSGHASTFFVFCTCCALILAYHYSLKSKKEYHRNFFLITLSMLTLFVLATLGAYSRIYLSQHFLSDVCMGSIIGFVTPFLVFYFGRDKILKIKSKGEKVES